MQWRSVTSSPLSSFFCIIFTSSGYLLRNNTTSYKFHFILFFFCDFPRLSDGCLRLSLWHVHSRPFFKDCLQNSTVPFPFFSPCCQPRRSFSSKLSHPECPNPNRIASKSVQSPTLLVYIFSFHFCFCSVSSFAFSYSFDVSPSESPLSSATSPFVSASLRAVWQSGNRHADSQQNVKNWSRKMKGEVWK